jgi:hypothetical protein
VFVKHRPCPTFNKLEISVGTYNPKALKERKAGFSRRWYAGDRLQELQCRRRSFGLEAFMDAPVAGVMTLLTSPAFHREQRIEGKNVH